MERISDRELQIYRTLEAPVELVWKAWTEPEHIAKWWGPAGFSNTIYKMDVKPGGEWLLTMHGPDGKNYPDKSVFREIDPLKKIVIEHLTPHFIITVVFETREEGTYMQWNSLFDTKELLDSLIKNVKADTAQIENVDKLEEHLQQLSGNKN